MAENAKYIVVLVFVVIVFTGLFFIYRAVVSPEEIIFYKEAPTSWERIKCILGGGQVETTSDVSDKSISCLDESATSEDCKVEVTYSCHYH